MDYLAKAAGVLAGATYAVGVSLGVATAQAYVIDRALSSSDNVILLGLVLIGGAL